MHHNSQGAKLILIGRDIESTSQWEKCQDFVTTSVQQKGESLVLHTLTDQEFEIRKPANMIDAQV